MPKRKRKTYSRPRRPFDKARIGEENVLKEKYGLKNKREIWKADAAIARIRNLAKELIVKSDEEKQAFLDKLNKKGFNVQAIADVLALNKEDWLKRRLQTIVFVKKLTTTPKQARQLIVHKHISVGDRTVNIPSYQVSLEEESTIKLNLTLKVNQEKPKAKMEAIKEEVIEEGKIETPEEINEEAKEEEKAEEVKEEVKEENEEAKE